MPTESGRLRILFLAPIIPWPAWDGDRQRAWHLLRHLTARHEVHFLGFLRRQGEYAGVKRLSDVCASVQTVPIHSGQIAGNCLRAWFGQMPLNVAAFASRAMKLRVAHTVKQNSIQVIHAYRLRMAPYALGVSGPRRILDYTDSLSRNFAQSLEVARNGWKKIYLRREAQALQRYEPSLAACFDACLISSEKDREVLLGLGSGREPVVITNGTEARSIKPAPRLAEEPRILFVGNMGYAPNAEGMRRFCRHTWPLVRRRLPQARLAMVGQVPPGERRAYPEAEILGPVENLTSQWHRARVAICPLAIASGRQLKVIEYFAAGVPVVATATVAENLGARHGHHLLVADSPADTAQAVIRLCQDTKLANRLRRNARRMALKAFDWSAAAKRMDQVYRCLNLKKRSFPCG